MIWPKFNSIKRCWRFQISWFLNILTQNVQQITCLRCRKSACHTDNFLGDWNKKCMKLPYLNCSALFNLIEILSDHEKSTFAPLDLFVMKMHIFEGKYMLKRSRGWPMINWILLKTIFSTKSLRTSANKMPIRCGLWNLWFELQCRLRRWLDYV